MMVFGKCSQLEVLNIQIFMYVNTHTDTYMYIYTHTHAHTHATKENTHTKDLSCCLPSPAAAVCWLSFAAPLRSGNFLPP